MKTIQKLHFLILAAVITPLWSQSSQSIDEKNQEVIDKYESLVKRANQITSKYHNGLTIDDSLALSKDKEYQAIGLEMQKYGPLAQKAKVYQIAHGTAALTDEEKKRGVNKMTDEAMQEFVSIVKTLKVNEDTRDDVASKINKYNINAIYPSQITILFQKGGFNLQTGLPEQDICMGIFYFDDLKKLISINITSNGKAIYTKSNHP
jgi:hypothetical protein